jgi:hypothetical protein
MHQIKMKRGIFKYSSFFLLLIFSCSANRSVNVGFDKKFSLDRYEKQIPITATSLQQFQELAKKFDQDIVLSRLITSNNYTIFVGILQNDRIKPSHISVKDSFQALVIKKEQKRDNEYLFKLKNDFVYITLAEAKNSIFIAIFSKDSALINNFFSNDYVQKKLY